MSAAMSIEDKLLKNYVLVEITKSFKTDGKNNKSRKMWILRGLFGKFLKSDVDEAAGVRYILHLHFSLVLHHDLKLLQNNNKDKLERSNTHSRSQNGNYL
jgi:hypothetical protein